MSRLVLLSFSVVCNSLRPHKLQHTWLPSPSLSTSLFRLVSFESNMPPSHLILCRPLLLLPSIFPSIRVFPNESVLHIRWPKNGVSASASVLLVNIQNWFPLGLTGLILQSKGLSGVFSSTILWHSALFIVQRSHPYMTAGKTIALTMSTFVGKVMSLLFNRLFRFVIAFLLRSKCLLISRLQSPSTVILEPKKNKVCHYFHCFPIYLLWSDGTGCHDLCFLDVEL